jgi:hypothetical protein
MFLFKIRLVGLFGRGIFSLQGDATYGNVYIRQYPERDSNPRFHCSGGPEQCGSLTTLPVGPAYLFI